MTGTRVLIIDDQKENVRYLTTIFEENGFYDIHGAFDGEEGLVKINEINPELILLDLRMPKKNGIVVFNELKKSPKYRNIPVIILTGEGGFLKHLANLREFHEDVEGQGDTTTEELLNRFIDSRPDAFLEKPVEPETLMATVRKILITLDEVKETRFREINELRKKKMEEHIIFKGFSFASDESSRNILMSTAASLLSPETILPDDFVWRSSDNQGVPMTREDLLAFHTATTEWVYRIYKASWDHKAAIDALTDIEAVENYDIQMGWPDNTL